MESVLAKGIINSLQENPPTYLPGSGYGAFAAVVDPRSKDNTEVFPLDGKSLDDFSDEDLISLAETSPILFKLSGTNVVRLSKTLVLKAGGNILPCEASALRLVAEGTGIPVPRVHRSFQVPDVSQYFGTKGYIVMDYIDGVNLGDSWKYLSSEQKKDAVVQTVKMVEQMQALTLKDPGPLGGGPCRGRFFTDYSAGPFSGAEEMEAWFNHKLTLCKHLKQAPAETPSFHFSQFVLVHQDISPRNLIRDISGQLWMIDWADAGAYPPAFEAAALACQGRFSEFSEMVLSLMPDRSGEINQLQSIMYGLTTAALA
ncbi:hypothetical protein FQN54_006757 [Arachnomyces sp. PD_36]|nr:hypothetical protein FQN54_006757 [Arachnomyces sp. PD_36]